ncbi:MAG: DUF2723 domain-containing protein [Deltaproteobacteria bacterium]|nr:DUF2723 domain-containing protein [Deltaproteobacteria bacterium]
MGEMNNARPSHSSYAFLAIISFGVYLITICPSVYLGDSGELTAAAFSLGIPHNSGYPLYALLGKIFCLIPIGNVGFRMNLMSSVLAVGCLLLVYGIVASLTSSRVAALSSTLILAFTPLFWLQTVASEVYSMHLFFLALLIYILWRWDREGDFHLLCLFAFVTGLSFGNHLQTLMLAPAVVFLVVARDRKALFGPTNILVLVFLFLTGLFVYIYLPIRTNAGAAIHWGDPNTLGRFLAHVTGRTHREVYMLSQTLLGYFHRTNQTLSLVGTQLGVILLVALWGFLKLRPLRWQVFFVLLITFDLAYAVFLNVVSIKVTPFALPTLVVLTILSGTGIAGGLEWLRNRPKISIGIQRLAKGFCYAVPALPLLLNFSASNQSSNYTAYEYAVNALRTTGPGSILFLEGDNNFFPVAYARIAERMRPDLILFDRHNILYKMPYLGEGKGSFVGEWEEYRRILEKEIIKKLSPAGIYYLTFVPATLSLPQGYRLVPEGLLNGVAKKVDQGIPYRVRNMWKYYSSDSFYEKFERDFMTRQVQAYFHLRYGHYLFLAAQQDLGLQYLRNASRIGYDDSVVRTKVANILADYGYFEEARVELEKVLAGKDEGTVSNSWGVYYYKKGDYGRAAEYFEKAVGLKPREHSYLKNLGLALYKAGDRDGAVKVFRRSLSIDVNQPEILELMKKEGLCPDQEKMPGDS